MVGAKAGASQDVILIQTFSPCKVVIVCRRLKGGGGGLLKNYLSRGGTMEARCSTEYSVCFARRRIFRSTMPGPAGKQTTGVVGGSWGADASGAGETRRSRSMYIKREVLPTLFKKL